MTDVRSILQALTVPDTNIVAQATNALRSHLKNSDTSAHLLQLLRDSDSTIRQLTAILLRKTLPERLKAASIEDVKKVRIVVLTALSNEQHPPARSALIALAATVASASKVGTQDGLPWPEIVTAALSNANDASLQLLAALADTCSPAILSEIDQLLVVLRAALESKTPRGVRAYAASMHSAATISGDVFPQLVSLLPLLADAVKAFGAIEPGSDKFALLTSDAFECCQLGAEVGGDAMRSYFPASVSFACDIFRHRDAANEARSAAAEYLMFAIYSKPKTMRKLHSMPEILSKVCEVASEYRILDDDEEEEQEEQPSDVACRVLETLAARPEFMTMVFEASIHCATCLLDCAQKESVSNIDRDSHSAAAFRVMAWIAEGCASLISDHAVDILGRMAQAAMNKQLGPRARANALYAISRVCEFLDTEEMTSSAVSSVGGFALNAIVSALRDPVKQVRESACTALEPVLTLCMLDADTLQPRFSEIIDALGSLGPNAAVEAVVAIGILAENAPDEFFSLKCLPDLVHATMVQMARTDEDGKNARVCGTDTAGSLVSVCKDKAIVEKLAAVAITGLDVDEPSIARATYQFFARMADAVGAQAVISYGPRVLEKALVSMEREDVEFRPEDEESNGAFQGLAAAVTQDGTMGDADEEEMGKGVFHIRTAFLEEKMLAIAVCGAFASAASTTEYVAFVEQHPSIAREVQALLKRAAHNVDQTINYFHEEVRAASQKSSVRYAIANVNLSKICPALVFDTSDVVSSAVQRAAFILSEDSDTWAVANTLSTCVVMCDEIPAEILEPYIQIFVDALKVLIKGDAMCQLTEEDEGDTAELEAGEDISGVANGICDLLEALVRNQRGMFADQAHEIYKLMMSNMFNSSSRNRGLIFGAIAGVLLFLSWDRCDAFNPPAPGTTLHEKALVVIDAIAAQVLPHALDALCASKGVTLQRNAVFLTGVVFLRVRSTNGPVWNQMQRAATLLVGVLKMERNEDNSALIDNAAGAVARMVTGPGWRGGGPLGNNTTVMQWLMKCIPMTGDPQENTTVARAVVAITQRDSEIVMSNVQVVVSCLTSAILLAVAQRKEEQEKRRIVGERQERDENDHMARLTDTECNKVVSVLAEIRRRFGDTPFANLKLKQEDAAALSAVLPQ